MYQWLKLQVVPISHGRLYYKLNKWRQRIQQQKAARWAAS